MVVSLLINGSCLWKKQGKRHLLAYYYKKCNSKNGTFMRIHWLMAMPFCCVLSVYAESASLNASKHVLTLEEAKHLACMNSPQLRATSAKVNAAIATERQSSLWENPSFLYEAENLGVNDPESETSLTEYTYSIAQTFEIGGKRAARKKLNHAIKNTRELEYKINEVNLSLEVEAAYIEVLALEEALKILVNQEELNQKLYVTVKNRVEAAKELESQKYKAEISLALAKLKHDSIQKELISAKERLAMFWNETTLHAQLDPEYFFKIQPLKDISYYCSKVETLPQIIKYSSMQNEKLYDIKLQKAQRIPDPTVSVGIRDLREIQVIGYVMSVSFPLPVFNLNSGNISRAIAELNQIGYEKQQAEVDLMKSITQNWYKCQSAYEESSKIKNSILPLSKKEFILANDIYEKGKFSYLEVLDAQRTLFNTTMEYYDALKRYHTYRIELEKIAYANI